MALGKGWWGGWEGRGMSSGEEEMWSGAAMSTSEEKEESEGPKRVLDRRICVKERLSRMQWRQRRWGVGQARSKPVSPRAPLLGRGCEIEK